jgi:hypothetical protein
MKQVSKSLLVLMTICSITSWAQDTIGKKKKMAPSLFAHNSMQRVGPNAVVIKGGIKHPHVFEFYLNGNTTFPSGTNVTNSARFNPSLGMDYIFENNIMLGLEGSYLIANPSLDFDTYAAPLGNNAAFPQNNNSSYKSTSLFINGGYSLKLKRAEKLRHEALNFVLGGGVVFNSYPEQSISGSFNGTTYSIFSNTPPNGYSKTTFALKPKIVFVYMINDWFGFNVNAQYQANFGSKDYAYSYKDLTNVDFTKPIDIINQQLYAAPTITQTTKGITSIFSIGAGFVFALGRKGDYRHGKGVKNILTDPTTM